MPVNIYKSGIHLGEEALISGNEYSGMVTFSGCHLSCRFCYVPEISFQNRGRSCNIPQFSALLENLVESGAKNINLISPTPHWKYIEPPLRTFSVQHPCCPIVLKTSGYEPPSIIRRMASIADVFVPDFKVWGPQYAKKAGLPLFYGKTAKDSLMEMQYTHANSVLDSRGKIRRGILLRHLIMPGFEKDSMEVVRALTSIPYRGYLNLMTHFVDLESHKIITATQETLSKLIQAAQESEIRILVNGKKGQRLEGTGVQYAS